MRSVLGFSVALAGLSMVACGEGSVVQAPPDAATGAADGARPPSSDAATAGLDATAPGPDAAAAGPDASTAGPDASAAGPDASAAGPDASATGPDASATGPDASAAGPDASAAGPDAGSGAPDAGTGVTPLGQVNKLFRVNNFGWRPADRKVAVLLGYGNTPVELRSTADNSVAATFTTSAVQPADEDSGDQFSTLDFSAFTSPGDYYLYLASANQRSYAFRIAEDVYDIVGAAAVKSYYFQRCNHDKALPYASDALGGFAGSGARWVDGACHLTDLAAPAGPGSAGNGTLDVRGGWHDAGDYQKTLWGRGVPEMLFGYEMNPGAWRDGQLNIPESGNGIPDILDEARWELDFYVRMQRPDGHFMSSAKGGAAPNGAPRVNSPPSASNEGRVYFDSTSPSGGDWSGGGVSVGRATANAVMSLAHAAIVFRAAGQQAIGDGYAAAARSGWTWLNGYSASGEERREKAAAASAVFRMDPTIATAKAFVESFPFSTWDGRLPWSVTPGEQLVGTAAWHYLLNEAGAASLKSTIKTAAQQVYVDKAFSQEGAYGGMFGDSGNGWDWGWGSNRGHGSYGSNLFMAARLGILGSHTQAQVEALAQKYVHYLLGLNPLNMVYLTNMAAYGGEHSSFQLYHAWFSYTGSDGDHGNAQYNGKPPGVVEPLYPYYSADTQTSTYGPAPGLVPGGPNWYYGGSYTIPNKTFPAYAYRDFSVGCDWSGSVCRAASWEITEPMDAYQGPVVMLLSFVMSRP